MRWLLGLAMITFAGCASTTPQESKIRALLWDAATECARASSTITITDVDHYGRVWYSLWQGGQQDVPAWKACYETKSRESFGKDPELAKYYLEQIVPRRQ